MGGAFACIPSALTAQAATSRLLFGMARDGKLPKFLAHVSPGRQVPDRAILVVGAVTVALMAVFDDRLDTLASMVNFGALTGFIFVHLSVIAHYTLRQKDGLWGRHLVAPVVGLIIIGSQIPKFLGTPSDLSLWPSIRTPAAWQWQGIVVGCVTAAVMLGAPKLTTKVPAAILALGSGILTYFGLSLIDETLLVTEGNRLIVGPMVSGAGSGGDFLSSLLARFHEMRALDLVGRLLSINDRDGQLEALAADFLGEHDEATQADQQGI